ncbi:MAG TPA: hypothetical protein VK147_12750 [Candidatus Didemnitutus sp.]|nr:hypothetical protein [Candidatus Didemnitutus sp.]
MRYTLGVIVLVLFQLAPLAIPLVWATEWTITTKGVLSALLALGIPEIGVLLAIALIGRSEVRRIWRLVKILVRRAWR